MITNYDWINAKKVSRYSSNSEQYKNNHEITSLLGGLIYYLL
jgi:hypothetical protein